ncbi:hypothetical protein WJX82_006504 [Trebouxia sp. C0006]
MYLTTAAQATYRSENQADVGGGSRFRQQDFMICKQRSKLLMCSVWLAVIPVSERTCVFRMWHPQVGQQHHGSGSRGNDEPTKRNLLPHLDPGGQANIDDSYVSITAAKCSHVCGSVPEHRLDNL